MELGQEYLAKARALEAEQWPGPEATEALMKLVTAAKADAASRRIAD